MFIALSENGADFLAAAPIWQGIYRPEERTTAAFHRLSRKTQRQLCAALDLAPIGANADRIFARQPEFYLSDDDWGYERGAQSAMQRILPQRPCHACD